MDSTDGLFIAGHTKNLSLVSFLPQNRVYWTCINGHQFSSPQDQVDWCPTCGGRGIDEVHYMGLARRINWLWMGKTLPNNEFTASEWRCPQGHKRFVSYAKLLTDHSCPACATLKPKHGHLEAERHGIEMLEAV